MKLCSLFNDGLFCICWSICSVGYVSPHLKSSHNFTPAHCNLFFPQSRVIEITIQVKLYLNKDNIPKVGKKEITFIKFSFTWDFFSTGHPCPTCCAHDTLHRRVLKKNMHQGRHQKYTQMIAKAFAVRETQLVKCFAVPGISLEHTKQNKIFSFNNLAVEGCVHGLESAGSSEM